MMPVHDTTVLPPDDETVFQQLAAQLHTAGAASITLVDGTHVQLPGELAQLLLTVADALAAGHAVTVAPQHTTLTTQQAADFLGVSRPTLVKLLEEGAIPHTRPGRHRRVRLSDVLTYRDEMHSASAEALDEMARISGDAGLYDDDVTRTRLRR